VYEGRTLLIHIIFDLSLEVYFEWLWRNAFKTRDEV
jgi:hypothetical protein